MTVQYFDLFNIFVNELVGALWLTIIIGVILITLITIKANLPYQVTTLFILLWFMIVIATTFLDIIWVFVVLGVGFLFYFRILKVVKG